jgi:elongation factor Ts
MAIAITAAMVKDLREKTDAPMMECKKALAEAEGDMEKAEEVLRIRLGNKASKASSRIAAEGFVLVEIQNQKAAILEINCETDFVAKNEDLKALGQAAVEAIIANNPADVASLGGLTYNEGTFESTRVDLVGKIGENMTFRRFANKTTDGMFSSYIHNGRIGVLVEHTGDDEMGKDIAMHIAACKPVCLSKEEVSAELIEKERNVYVQQAIESGKAPEIAEKMVQGRINKFLEEITLLNQKFVKNGDITIEQLAQSKNATIKSFTMFVVGEGIEKKTVDFATEVAEQVAAAQAA